MNKPQQVNVIGPVRDVLPHVDLQKIWMARGGDFKVAQQAVMAKANNPPTVYYIESTRNCQPVIADRCINQYTLDELIGSGDVDVTVRASKKHLSVVIGCEGDWELLESLAYTKGVAVQVVLGG